MKPTVSHAALFGGAALIALMSMGSYLAGIDAGALCLLCLATAIALGIVSFTAALAFGWIVAFGYLGMRSLAAQLHR